MIMVRDKFINDKYSNLVRFRVKIGIRVGVIIVNRFIMTNRVRVSVTVNVRVRVMVRVSVRVRIKVRVRINIKIRIRA